MIFSREDPIGVDIEYYRGLHGAHAASAKYIGTQVPHCLYIYI